MPACRCRALLAVAAIVTSVTVPGLRSGAATTPARISATPGYPGAFTEDAPDPHTIRVGSTYYTYTTAATWENPIGILKSSSPNTGFHTIAGHPWGSTAFPSVHWSSAPASWQVPGTQVAPG